MIFTTLLLIILYKFMYFFGLAKKELGFYEKYFFKVLKLLLKTKIFLTLT